MFRSAVLGAAPALFGLPAVGQAGEVAGFETSGYVDFSTQVNDWDDKGPASLGFTNVGSDDSFSLNQAALKLSKTPASGFGAVVGVVMGDATPVIAANSGGGDIALAEGYVQYTNGDLTVIGGKFFTLAGSEVFASTGNAQATRGLLFNLQPLSLTGVRGTFKLGDAFSVSAGAVNAVTGATADGNDQKSLELNVTVTPIAGLSLALTHYETSNAATDDPTNAPEASANSLTDVVVNFSTGPLSLGANVDLLSFDLANTDVTGIALYAGFQVSPAFKLSGRFETATADPPAPGTDTDATSITLTGGFACSKAFDLLAEVRNDSIDTTPATKPFGAGADADDSGNTLVVKGIYKF